MPVAEAVLRELEALGTEQNRKTYRRHGVTEPLYGVSYANLGMMRKRIKVDQALAEQLWRSGNHDARVLATMIADPKTIDQVTLERWADDLHSHTLTDAVVEVVARTPNARSLMERWIVADHQWRARIGWHALGRLALSDPTLDDAFFTPYLERIEREIHTQPNRLKEAMNNALIAIGQRNAALEAQAIDHAQRIGKVEVDHGDTSCKTPDAVSYIRKARARQEAKAAKAT